MTDRFIFLITANGLWKTCSTSVLFSKIVPGLDVIELLEPGV